MKKALAILFLAAILLFAFTPSQSFADTFTVNARGLTDPVLLNDLSGPAALTFLITDAVTIGGAYGPPFNVTSANLSFSFRDDADPTDSYTVDFTSTYSETDDTRDWYWRTERRYLDMQETAYITDASGTNTIAMGFTQYYTTDPVFVEESTTQFLYNAGMTVYDVGEGGISIPILFPTFGLATIHNKIYSSEWGWGGEATFSGWELDSSYMQGINEQWSFSCLVWPNIGDMYLTAASMTFNISPSYVSSVPEPASLLLLTFGLIGISMVRKLRK